MSPACVHFFEQHASKGCVEQRVHVERIARHADLIRGAGSDLYRIGPTFCKIIGARDRRICEGNSSMRSCPVSKRLRRALAC